MKWFKIHLIAIKETNVISIFQYMYIYIHDPIILKMIISGVIHVSLSLRCGFVYVFFSGEQCCSVAFLGKKGYFSFGLNEEISPLPVWMLKYPLGFKIKTIWIYTFYCILHIYHGLYAFVFYIYLNKIHLMHLTSVFHSFNQSEKCINWLISILLRHFRLNIVFGFLFFMYALKKPVPKIYFRRIKSVKNTKKLNKQH